MRSSPVKGSLPLRFGLAGTAVAVAFSTPGRTKVRAPFLCSEAEIVASSDSMTALTPRRSTPLASARCAIRADLESVSLSGFIVAADLAAGAVRLADLVAARLAIVFWDSLTRWLR